MIKSLFFRLWFYFRNGWGTYFAFIFAAVNTLTVTYFLAIENYPILKNIFPTFIHYVIIISFIGVPLLIGIGYIHFKRSQAFSSESDVVAESQPYNFRLPPGYNVEVIFPLYLLISNMMIKWSKNEKLNEREINELIELQEKIKILIQGGFVGKPTSNL